MRKSQKRKENGQSPFSSPLALEFGRSPNSSAFLSISRVTVCHRCTEIDKSRRCTNCIDCAMSRAPRSSPAASPRVPPAAQNLFLKKKVKKTAGFPEEIQKDFNRFAAHYQSWAKNAIFSGISLFFSSRQPSARASRSSVRRQSLCPAQTNLPSASGRFQVRREVPMKPELSLP